ncbi:hypothetical protein FSP39_000420 [Pinctada imbricata]|uniref:Small ribosomal subunit protein mS33 n=1 Tax=Pinctada imbricata TaxID=66713 RepID=A0AA88Y9V9_PINIB|nr:hypothetical protein FSP39_000420 [Pinctada imbricata]
MAQPSMYAQRMAKLSARIFGEVTRTTNSKSMKVVQLYSEKPLYKRPEIINYYPLHPQMERLFGRLRYHGLYRDSHLDFKDYMNRMRKKKGKGKPAKGEGKKAALRK